MTRALVLAVLLLMSAPAPRVPHAVVGTTTRDELVAVFGPPLRISLEAAREGDIVMPGHVIAAASLESRSFADFPQLDPDDSRPVVRYEVLEFVDSSDAFVFREGEALLHSRIARPAPDEDTLPEARATHGEEPRVSWHEHRHGCLLTTETRYTFAREGVVLVAFADPHRIERKIVLARPR